MSTEYRQQACTFPILTIRTGRWTFIYEVWIRYENPTYLHYMLQRIGKVLVIHRRYIPSLLREYLEREHLCQKPYVPDKVPTANRTVYGHRHFVERSTARARHALYLQCVDIYVCLVLKQHQSIAKLKDNPIPVDSFVTNIPNTEFHTKINEKYFFNLMRIFIFRQSIKKNNQIIRKLLSYVQKKW